MARRRYQKGSIRKRGKRNPYGSYSGGKISSKPTARLDEDENPRFSATPPI